jgi:hypothetical protein
MVMIRNYNYWNAARVIRGEQMLRVIGQDPEDGEVDVDRAAVGAR